MAIELINGIELELQGGTRGLQGIQGEKGDPGNDYTPMIGTVDTLAPGLPATVSTNIDEEQNIVYFNFGIPEGEKGDRGDTNFKSFNIVNGELIVTDQDGISMNIGKVAMVAKGNYDNSTSYQTLDTVQYNDSTYMALKSTLGNLPTDTEYWQLIGGGLQKEDIVDNLNSNDATKMLSAKQGNELDEKKITKFITLGDLRASTALKVDMVVKTLGYYTINDGGGALYKIRNKFNSDVDNGGSVIIIGNYTATMIVEDEVNVLSWGVKRQDATTQSNLNALLNYYSSGNISIYFPSGKYYLTETIYLPPQTTIRGDGGGTTIMWYGNEGEYIFDIKKGRKFCSIHDLYIDGRFLAGGIYDCDKTNVSSGTTGIRTKIFNLSMEHMFIGLRLDGMGSEVYNIFCNGSGEDNSYSKSNSIGIYINGTDNYISNVRIQLFYYGALVIGGNNRFVTVKLCVNRIGAELRPGECGLYMIDLQENLEDNLIMKETTESTLLMNNQVAGFLDHYVNGADLHYSLLKMNNCKYINITGTLGCRRKLGSGSCGNEKYAFYIDDLSSNINGLFSYYYPANVETYSLDKPLFYCYETSTNKIIINNEEMVGETTFQDANVTNSWEISSAMDSFSRTNNVLTITYKNSLDITQEQLLCNFTINNQNLPKLLEIISDKVIFTRVRINVRAPSHNKYSNVVSFGVDTTSYFDYKGNNKMKISYIGDTELVNQYGDEIEEVIGYPVEEIRLQLMGYILNRNNVTITIKDATSN